MPPSALPLALGAVSLLATTATVALDAVVAKGSWSSSNHAGLAASISSALEGAVLLILIVLFWRVLRSSKFSSEKFSRMVFAGSLLACTAAATVSVIMIILINAAKGLPEIIDGVSSIKVLVGLAVALGIAFAAQLAFVVVHFILGRPYRFEKAHALYVPDEGRYSPEMRVKSIPYSRTVASMDKSERRFTTEEQSRPGTSSGQSAHSSVRTSLSQVVRPMSSKTRLLSTSSRTPRRAPSLDSVPSRDQPNLAQDGFDSWDTSSVESASIVERPVINTSLTVPPRVLETIPASPTVSRSPSPGNPLNLETPGSSRRSRSYSPVPRGRKERSLSPQPSMTELHIHPLFRSDSPSPAPAATPGTIIIASPNAGRTVSEKSLSRMRSGSLPVSSSPLSRQASEDSIRKSSSHVRGTETSSMTGFDQPAERALTPPVPEWILNAGARCAS